MGNCCSTAEAQLDRDARARRVADQAEREANNFTPEDINAEISALEEAIDVAAASSPGTSLRTAKSQRKWDDRNGPFGLSRNPDRGFTDAVASAAGRAWAEIDVKSWIEEEVKQVRLDHQHTPSLLCALSVRVKANAPSLKCISMR